MSFRYVKNCFLRGFVLFAECLDIRILLFCYLSNIFLSDNGQSQSQRGLYGYFNHKFVFDIEENWVQEQRQYLMPRNELKYEDRSTAKAKIAKMQDYRPEAYIFMIWGASFIISPVKFVKFFARKPWIIFFVFCAI